MQQTSESFFSLPGDSWTDAANTAAIVPEAKISPYCTIMDRPWDLPPPNPL